MKIFIYTEGGHYLGLGNVYRMKSLAQGILNVSDCEITFITTSEDYVCDIIKESKTYNCIKLDNLQEVEIALINQDADILIIDVLNISSEFVSNIKINSDAKIVLFGNNNDSNNFADLVVNAIISTVNFKNENIVDQYETRYLKGPKYLTLKDDFVSNAYNYSGQLKNILLLFGGTDQANLSTKVLKELIDDPKANNIKFNLIIGAGFKFMDELKIYLQDERVKVFENVSNVNEIMLQNDFLITSAGTAFFEGLYLGLPAIALFQNKSQADVFGNFFNTYTYENINSTLELIFDIYDSYSEYKRKLNQLEIGLGKNDIINNIINLKK